MKISFRLKHFSDLSLSELYEILKLRSAVFVVEQDCIYLDQDDLDQEAYHLMGYDDRGLCLYTRLVAAGVKYADACSIGRVVGHPRTRGKGFGKRLMMRSIYHSKKLFDSSSIKISAQTYLINFYSDLNFKTIGVEYLEDGIPHVLMEFNNP